MLLLLKLPDGEVAALGPCLYIEGGYSLVCLVVAEDELSGVMIIIMIMIIIG